MGHRCAWWTWGEDSGEGPVGPGEGPVRDYDGAQWKELRVGLSLNMLLNLFF